MLRGTNKIHECPAWYLFYFIMKNRLLCADFSARTGHMSSYGSFQKGRLISYFHVVNYLLNTCGADDIISNARVDIINQKQPQELNSADYSQTICTKALHCGPVKD